MTGAGTCPAKKYARSKKQHSTERRSVRTTAIKNIETTKNTPLVIPSNSSATEILQALYFHDIIDSSDVRKILVMNKKEKVLSVHKSSISQGQGADKRFYTYIYDESAKNHRKKIRKSTEEELIDFLYDHYFGNQRSYEKCTLKDIYEEWIQYKLATANRSNTVYRIDSDYKKFYVNEPLSAKILSIPLLELTVADIKQWAYSIIKKYELKKKAYQGATTILRQVYDYLIDKEVTDKNPCKLIRINPSAFKKDRKKPAETQIFYREEIVALIDYCIKRAAEDNDVAFLAIPLFFYTGLRIGECLGLAFSDCNEKEHTIYVHRMLAEKMERLPDGTWSKRDYELVDFLKGNGDPREIIVSDEGFEIIKMIKKHHQSNFRITDLMFPDVSKSNIQFKLYRACDALKIAERSPHKWRKTYISNLLNKGADLDFVRNQVGHKDIQTTLNSYTYSTSHKEKQLEQLETALSL